MSSEMLVRFLFSSAISCELSGFEPATAAGALAGIGSCFASSGFRLAVELGLRATLLGLSPGACCGRAEADELVGLDAGTTNLASYLKKYS